MKQLKFVVVAAAFCAAGMITAAQAPQTPAAPQAPAGGGQGRGRPRRSGWSQEPRAPAAGAQAPARGITVNANPVQKAHADITGPNGVTGTADFIEYAQGNGTLMQVTVAVTGLPAGMHGMHIHAVGKCDGTTTPPFTSAGGHFDPGPVRQHGRRSESSVPQRRSAGDQRGRDGRRPMPDHVHHPFQSGRTAVVVRCGRFGDRDSRQPGYVFDGNSGPGSGGRPATGVRRDQEDVVRRQIQGASPAAGARSAKFAHYL